MIAEQKIRTQRILGQLLKESEVSKNFGKGTGSNQYAVVDKTDHSKTKLSDFGITKDQSSTFQKIAALPEEIFEQEIATAKVESNVKKTLLLKWAKVRTIPFCYKYYIMATQNDLTRADIVKISIDHINNFRMVRLHGLRLENIDLEGLDLHGFIFTNCKLSGASFRNCKLNNATFTGADLTDCDFTDATGLSQGMFEGATMEGVLHNMSNVRF